MDFGKASMGHEGSLTCWQYQGNSLVWSSSTHFIGYSYTPTIETRNKQQDSKNIGRRGRRENMVTLSGTMKPKAARTNERIKARQETLT